MRRLFSGQDKHTVKPATFEGMVTQLGTGEPLRVTVARGSGARSVYRDGAKIFVFATTGHSDDRGEYRFAIYSRMPVTEQKTSSREIVHRIVFVFVYSSPKCAAYELSDDAGTSRDIHLEHDKP